MESDTVRDFFFVAHMRFHMQIESIQTLETRHIKSYLKYENLVIILDYIRQ